MIKNLHGHVGGDGRPRGEGGDGDGDGVGHGGGWAAGEREVVITGRFVKRAFTLQSWPLKKFKVK